ncbi:MAG: hypothetical protein QCI82_10345 [Candidatus Thermoplasmatota archaeon]|nr:hypothetical protein [Candidatus Thermoplasmatota archaeon]
MVYTVTTVVSIRVNDETLDEIRRMGYKPSEYLAMILEARLRMDRSRPSIGWFRNNRLKSKGITGTELIREDRDSR